MIRYGNDKQPGYHKDEKGEKKQEELRTKLIIVEKRKEEEKSIHLYPRKGSFSICFMKTNITQNRNVLRETAFHVPSVFQPLCTCAGDLQMDILCLHA
ncbi:hypothetical protein CEXT_43651 [Caerostris extrusa]|uniref:Uncharacterized protein n=1 Tax=Caerostris extrusa TaxID=172846 RepID=A0AAV4Y842_CAEEX|nr:hypothetical protein CEXT_43651 [Caerostris extrusa]